MSVSSKFAVSLALVSALAGGTAAAAGTEDQTLGGNTCTSSFASSHKLKDVCTTGGKEAQSGFTMTLSFRDHGRPNFPDFKASLVDAATEHYSLALQKTVLQFSDGELLLASKFQVGAFKPNQPGYTLAKEAYTKFQAAFMENAGIKVRTLKDADGNDVKEAFSILSVPGHGEVVSGFGGMLAPRPGETDCDPAKVATLGGMSRVEFSTAPR